MHIGYRWNGMLLLLDKLLGLLLLDNTWQFMAIWWPILHLNLCVELSGLV
jgi:hypothetical protein